MNRRSFRQSLFLLAAWFALSGPAAAQDPAVRAYVDRTELAVGEAFTLSVEISGTASGEPKLPPMDDFGSFLGSGSSQQIQFINGQMSATRTITYTFQATRAGKFTIGPVSVNLDGKVQKTDPITIEIGSSPSAGRNAPNRSPRPSVDEPDLPEGALFVRALPSARQVYLNQPVVISYKIYTRLDLSSYGVSKQPAAGGFWVEDYPIGNRPQTSVEVINGKRYVVAVIKKLALYPTTSGKKTVSPLELQCEVTLPRRRGSLLDDFFGSPFRGFGEPVTKLISSDEVEINVLPLPEEGKPRGFDGAVGTFSVDLTADKDEVSVNDAATLRLTVSGEGNFPTMGTPELTLPSTFETYPPKIEEKIDKASAGLRGSKTYEYVVIPRSAGAETIGPFDLAYFDPQSKSYKTARSDAVTLHVSGSGNSGDEMSAPVAKQELKLLGQDIRFIKTNSAGFRKIGAGRISSTTLWVAGLLPLLALAAAFSYRKRLDRVRGDIAYARDRRAFRLARKRLAKARALLDPSTQSEFFAEAGKALHGFLADKLNIAEAGLISDQVGALLAEKGVPEEVTEAYFDCMHTCDLQRFAPSQATKAQMMEFLERAERAMGKLGEAL